MGFGEEREIIFLPEDRERCRALLERSRECGDSARPIGDLVARVALHFRGAPYEAGTLEREGPEQLVVNLRAFDCVTFVETTVALARMIRSGKSAFGDYTAALERIRYRGGRRDGYPSRLHYFSEWLRDNGRKGIVRDITRDLGGTPSRKAFHELTDQREKHPPLRDLAAFRQMRAVEAGCSRRTLYSLPKTDFPEMEKRIENGDILAVTTDADGIDVSHTGIAVRHRGRLHLLHASSRGGRVLVSNATLHRYLQARRTRTGIIIGRAMEPDQT